MDITELTELSKRLGGFEPLVTELRVSRLVYYRLKMNFNDSPKTPLLPSVYSYFGIPIIIDTEFPPGYWEAKGRDGDTLMTGTIDE